MRALFLPGLLIYGLFAAEGAEVRLRGHTFTVPDGFTLEIAAEAPAVQHPRLATFDDEGRLYLVEEPLATGAGDEAPAETIVRLIDSDRDGVFERKFAFGEIPLPAGNPPTLGIATLAWRDGVLYAGTSGGIMALRENESTGEVAVSDWGYAPSADAKPEPGTLARTAGPWPVPTGWVWAWQPAPDQRKAGAIFRQGALETEPETYIRPYSSRGPSGEVAFDREGECFLVGEMTGADGIGQGLMHVTLGQWLDYHSENEPPRWPAAMAKPLAGMVANREAQRWIRYQGHAFGPDSGSSFIGCGESFGLRRVVVKPKGASFEAQEQMPPFASGASHPRQVLEDADGSLLILDAGDLKAGVAGAIYRLRKINAAPVQDPWGLTVDWPNTSVGDLVVYLTDTRPAVRKRAQRQMLRNPDYAVAAISGILPNWPVPTLRQTVLWTLAPMNTPMARMVNREALEHKDARVRQTAAMIAGLTGDTQAGSALVSLLHGPAPVARAAAEALTRLKHASAVPALLAANPDSQDPMLEHSILYALFTLASPKELMTALDSPVPGAARLAALALHARPDSPLRKAQVEPWLQSDDPALKEAATWILARHPEWAGTQ